MSAAQPQVDLFRAAELGNTAFLVSDPEAGEAVAIDPARPPSFRYWSTSRRAPS